ncbi:MAG: metallophosphoesterase [Burkholderiaceae bacterium]
MRVQLLSDLHLESEEFDPEPAPGAELLVLGGDIDSSWAGFERFRGWPVPVLLVAGNHEFDGRELDQAWPALADHCARLGVRLLERESLVLNDSAGRRIRFVATIRWADFDVFGPAQRDRAMRAASYFQRVMRATRRGEPFDAAAVRTEALACRRWLQAELTQAPRSAQACDATVVLTHFAPSLRSADLRYGAQPTTASFCNADDDLLPYADLWLHGHVHCRHDYSVDNARGRTRVVCNSRGLSARGESQAHDAALIVEI